MVNEQIIEKNRKYLFQFPDEVSSEKQAEYLNKVNKELETNDFVAIDPKVKIYPKSDISRKEIKEDKKVTDKKPDEKEEPKDTKSSESTEKKEGNKSNDESTDADNAKEDKTEEKPEDEAKPDVDVNKKEATIEKVEIPAKETSESKEPVNVLMGEDDE